jgi:alanyl-tRNA synthetase
MAKPFTTAEIREAYLNFFASKGCVRYPSASLVPENDPTTLFTVAGMSQFKDMFLGRGTHPFSRATTVQKCIRTNDIMNVGRTARHHTFFEMLGNFSFNDYFKKEAIHWAWEFLTKVLQLPEDRLSISVHRIDGEAYRIWREEVGIPANRIFKLDDNDNFWPANAPKEGPEGPGGCCSEIFWDHRINDDPNDNLTSNTGRFVEIWNLVFPEFNVRKPNPDGTPNLENLGRTNIDTGSGLERVAAVMQGVYNNFDTDIFQQIIARVCEISGKSYDKTAVLGAKTQASEDNALIRRIADHMRAVTFCIADGALPGNSDRGYIVRRLIRRATLDLDKLGCEAVRLNEVVPVVVEAMGRDYPEITKRQDLARETLKAEEALFRRTLRKGLDLFQRSLDRQKGGAVFSGDDAFELVTTHGFPKEVIAELASNEGLTLDDERFKVRWAEHQQVSNTKQIEVFTSTALQEAKPRLGATPFVGYNTLKLDTAITLLEVGGKDVAEAAAGTAVRLALRETPFYAESGGQIGDQGILKGADFTIQITETQKDDGLYIHSGSVIAGTARPGAVTALIDQDRRTATTRHHSATHLMHAALTAVLGDHVEQQGSQVTPEGLRFDFNHPKALSREESAAIEAKVNGAIVAKFPGIIAEMGIDDAKKLGAKAQFGEKYGSTVRVVTFGADAGANGGAWSREFCGGCHVANTAEIGSFRIVREEAVAAGIRRITAVAGAAAQALAAEEARIANACAEQVGLHQVSDARVVGELARQFKTTAAELPERITALAAQVRELAVKAGDKPAALTGELPERIAGLQDDLKRLMKLAEKNAAQAAAAAVDGLIAAKRSVQGIELIAAVVPGLDGKALRTLADLIKGQVADAVVVLGSAADGKVGLIAVSSSAAQKRGVNAGQLIGKLAPMVGGKGGGKPDLAQAGGSDAGALASAIAAVETLVSESLTGTGASGAKG